MSHKCECIIKGKGKKKKLIKKLIVRYRIVTVPHYCHDSIKSDYHFLFFSFFLWWCIRIYTCTLSPPPSPPLTHASSPYANFYLWLFSCYLWLVLWLPPNPRPTRYLPIADIPRILVTLDPRSMLPFTVQPTLKYVPLWGPYFTPCSL